MISPNPALSVMTFCNSVRFGQKRGVGPAHAIRALRLGACKSRENRALGGGR